MALQASRKRTTPPGSILNGPPTPPSTDTKPTPRVERILRALSARRNGTFSGSPWTVFKLTGEEYEELLHHLEQDEPLKGFVKDKVRYDYDPVQSEFILRIPTSLHDAFIQGVSREVIDTLKRLADTETAARPFIQRIDCLMGGELKLILDDGDQDPLSKKSPDLRFQHDDAEWPGVIIEVAYTQKSNSLARLAEKYILDSDGNIGVVVGLDLVYKKSKEASFHVWRLKEHTNDDGEVVGEVEKVVDNQLFRDAEGNPVLSSSSGLKLSLKDFAIEELSQGVPDSSIVIDAKTLCKLLSAAENWQEKTTVKRGIKRPRLTKKERRLQTPPEQLTVSDEEKLIEDERRKRRKQEKLDKSYGE